MTKFQPAITLEDYPFMLQVRHVREILGVSLSKTYEVMNSKKCPTIRVGGRLIVMRDSFIKFLYSCEGDNLMEENE